MSDGWCPFASRYPTTKFWKGNEGRKAAVMHIAQGSYEAAVSWLQNATSNPNSSAHFVIAKDGRIAQLVSIWDSAWANGLRYIDGKWYTPADPPRLESPSWVDLVDGVNPNLYTISVEHEGYYTERWTAEMYAANTRLLKWVAQELSQTGAPFRWAAHRTLVGHNEIEPVDRRNCPGPNVDLQKIAADSNVSDLFDSITLQSQQVHVYGTTALVSLPSYNIVTQVTETDVPVAGYLDYGGTHWFISQYSYQNRLSNFFDSSSTQRPVQDMVPGIALNPGYRDTVTPGAADLQALGPSWVRVLLSGQYQNSTTGQNSELDWLLERCSPLGVKVLALVNVETIGAAAPPHGSGWGDASSGYIGRVSDLVRKIAGYYKDRLAAVEVWNEPDVQGILSADYAALLKACYTKVKGVSSLAVVSAGICCGESFTYLKEVSQAARGSFDYAGWHVYAERVDGFPGASFGSGELRNSLSSARALAGKPLWVTEVGAQLDWNWGSASAGDSVATYLTRAVDLMRNLGRNVVGQTFWFTWYSPGESWGLVDTSYNKRPAWFAFQKEGKAAPPPPAQAAISGVSLSPSSFEAGQLLNISVTVKNNSNQELPTQGPNPGFIYNEGETFQSRGLNSVAGAFRIGLDFDGRTGIDHPYRWGLTSPLASGSSATITGAVRLVNPGKKNYWVGLVQELTTWVQDGQGSQAITVTPSTVPPGTTPVITSVSFSPATLNSGDVLNVTIVVRNDSKDALPTMGPNPGFAYQEGDTFAARGFVESQGMYRVGVDFDGRSGVDHPYRWGLGSPLAAGQARVIMGSIQLKNNGTKNYWGGLVRERVAWLADKKGTQAITVSPAAPPPPAGKPTISDVTLTPSKSDRGLLLQITVTVENNSNMTLPTQGPDPGTTYNEDENYIGKGYPPGAGAFRIGADFDGRTGIDHPYRWGLGQPLAPGQSVIVTGYVLLNRQQTTNFWVALIQEGTGAVVDALGRTLVTI